MYFLLNLFNFFYNINQEEDNINKKNNINKEEDNINKKNNINKEEEDNINDSSLYNYWIY
tara:strand:+ start:168 stop:347 length:180 start_codon:yes stop_codon:yes gene_type:complete